MIDYIMQSIAAFIGLAMLLFLPFALFLPERYSEHTWKILLTISLIGSQLFLNYKSEKPKHARDIKKLAPRVSRLDKECLSEEREKGRSNEDAELFCYYECVVGLMELGEYDISEAEAECEE